jgi:hypothetical protein
MNVLCGETCQHEKHRVPTRYLKLLEATGFFKTSEAP